MMRLMLLGSAALALFAATSVLRSRSISGNDITQTAMLPGVHELQHAVDSSKLPVEAVDDRSVVYPQQSAR